MNFGILFNAFTYAGGLMSKDLFLSRVPEKSRLKHHVRTRLLYYPMSMSYRHIVALHI